MEHQCTQLQEALRGKPTFFLFQNISSQLKGELRYIFNAIHTDGSEEISRSELKTYLRIADRSLSDAEINYLFESIDIDKSGKIDFEEFGELILRVSKTLFLHIVLRNIPSLRLYQKNKECLCIIFMILVYKKEFWNNWLLTQKGAKVKPSQKCDFEGFPS